MNVKCPNCTKVVSVADALAGKRATCPFCKQVFSVPGSAASAPLASAKTPSPSVPQPAPPIAPRSSARSAGTSSKKAASPRLGILEQAAPLPVSMQAVPRAAPAAGLQPAPPSPALWQLPGLYGAASVGFGIAAFPVATVFASEHAGLGLAGLGALLGLVGLIIFLLYRRASSVLCFLGLALGVAVAFGLVQDIKRAELARQADSVGATLAGAEAALEEIEKQKKETEDLHNEAKQKLEAAKKSESAAKEERDTAKLELKQSLKEKQIAEEARKDAEKKLTAALQKEKELETKDKDLQKQIDTLKEQQTQAEKAKKEAEEAQTLLKKEKEEADKKLDEARDLLEEAKEAQKKAEAAIKLLMSRLKDPDPKLQLKATQGIALLGSDAPPEAAFALCEAVVSSDDQLKQAAFPALHKVRPDLYVPVVTLAKSTKFNQPGVDVAVFGTAKKLGELGKAAAPTAPIFASHLKTFLDLKNPKEADLETAGFLTTALGKIAADAAAVELLGKIARYRIDELRETEAPLRHEARAALFEIGKGEAGLRKQIVPLLSAGLKEENANQRKQVCDWLAAYGPEAEAAVPELMKLLSDPKATVSEAADRALKAIQKGEKALEK